MNKSVIVKIVDSLLWLAAIIVVLIAVLFSLIRLFLPHMPQYQGRIEQWASQTMHQPVKVENVQVGWRGFEPEFRFINVAIFNDVHTVTLLKVQELDVGIAVLKSLFKWHVEPGLIVVSGVNIKVQQQADGKYKLNEMLLGKGVSSTAATPYDYAEWLFSQGNIYLQNVDLTWIDRQGKTLHFENVRMKISNHLLNYQILGAAVLLQPQPANFNFILNVGGDVLSNKDFTAKLYLHVNNLLLSSWLEHRLGDAIDVTKGISSFSLWGTWSNQQVENWQALVTANNVAMHSHYFAQDLFFKQLSGRLLWTRDAQGWSLSCDSLQMILNDVIWSPTSLSAQVIQAGPKSAAMQILQISKLDITKAKNLLLQTTLLSSQRRQLLQQLNPSGELDNFTLTHNGAGTVLNQFVLQTDFAHLSWVRWKKLPGGVNLTGQINLAPSGGSLELNSSNALLDFGTLFRYWIPVKQVDANVAWHKDSKKNWRVKITHFVAENAAASVNATMDLTLSEDFKNPTVNLLAGFNLVQPVAAMHFLPVGIMSEKLVNWLQQAIVAGKSATGSLILRGPLHDFPFAHQEGRFVIDSQLKDFTLNYHNNWPVIQHMDADLNFDDKSISVTANTGQILQNNIQNVQANIADLGKGILTINGAVAGDLSEGLQFLQQSPLNASIGKRLQPLQLHGPMNLALQMTVPLKAPGMDILGNVTLKNADLQIPQYWNLHATDLQGDLQFTQDSLTGNLQGTWFDKPLQIKITSIQPGTKQSVTQLDLGQGQMTLTQLQQRFHVPESPYMQGTLNYSALLQLPNGDNKGPSKLIVNSNIQGISVNLPAPLGKTTNDAVNSQLQLLFTGHDEPLALLLKYGDRLSAALSFVNDKNGNLALTKGEISLGGKQASLQTQTGLLIDGSLPSFSWTDWKPILGQSLQTAKKTSTTLLRKVDITFGQLNLLGMPLTQTEMTLEPQADAWQVSIDNPTMSGRITIPHSYPRGTVLGSFTRLYLSGDGQQKNTLNPSDIPALNFTCDDFRYGNKKFGRIMLQTAPSGSTLQIKQFGISSPSFNLNATGEWKGSGDKQQSALNGILVTSSIGTVLQDWNATKSLVGGNGNAHFSLQWPGAPYQPKLQNLSGKLNFSFNDGRIINLSNSAEAELGLGRVLNLFSLQTLPRRLRFDFSDLTDAGFSFDVLRGDFVLTNGSAVTKNAYLNGPVAKITMQGRIGLSQQDYDLDLMVTPYITSSLPIVATVAGGPIAGAITWVAGKVFSSLVNKAMTYQYHVTGSWGNPYVIKLLVPPSGRPSR
jgi:uncharacterized protein (TIGR02099 family)